MIKEPFDQMHEECGIFGVYGHPEAANLTYLGLYALQHRGQEASGIVTFDGQTFHEEKGTGLVSDIFSQERLSRLKGSAAIGHNRYSTAGGSRLENVQPIRVNYALGTLAMVHNGNLINADFLRDELEAYGAIFQSSMDSEVIVHLIAHSRQKRLSERIVESLSRVRGAYSLIFLSEEGMIGVRDPYGVRPLSLGKMNDGGYVLASETCTFDLIEAEFVRDIEPGEVVQITEKGITSFSPFLPTEAAHCVFEYVYFSRPDSNVFGRNVYEIRKRLGKELLQESAVDADLVIPVPDSGVPAALGYAEASKLPYDTGLIRNHYVGRTFIEPQQSIRHFGVKIKLNAIRGLLEGKRVIVVDDSLVRGTTSRKIVKMIRAAGAKEIHVRISSPPIVSPCFYGIDTPTRHELVAASHSVEEIRKYITADSLSYLSNEGMFRAVYNRPLGENTDFCTACFSEKYPIPFTGAEIRQLGLFSENVSSSEEA
ncbi:Amidophosphoribosyltransferase [hydrothermal vent metagenome]|uniref:amidophosphoribosyltransferase n=1 Tax=hydrothermal vent metagenome TaxID=652676 RepID=A0A3B1DXM2_9ZZZZ